MRALLYGCVLSLALAGCAGGAKSLAVPPLGQPSIAKSSLTVFIPNAASSAKKAIPANAVSINVAYVGAPPGTVLSATATAPGTAVSTGSIPLTSTNCAPFGAGRQCTVAVQFQVGNLALYIATFDNANNLLSNGAFLVTVSANGALTSASGPPFSLIANPNAPGAGLTFVPLSAILGPKAVNPQATPDPVLGNNAATTPIGLRVTASDGSLVPPNQPIPPLRLTLSDNSGNTCLRIASAAPGAAAPTPCPYMLPGQTVTATLQYAGDNFAVQWNNRPISTAAITVTGALAGASATPIPVTVAVQPALGHAAAGGQNLAGGVAFDSISGAVYATTTSTTNILEKVPYANGTAGTSSLLNPGTALTNQPNGLAIGPDSNLWIAEFVTGTAQEAAVYALNQPALPAGPTVAQGGAAKLAFTATSAGMYQTSIVQGDGYLWILTSDDGGGGPDTANLFRINPSTGAVLANNSAPGTPATAGAPITLACLLSGGAIYRNGTLYAPEGDGQMALLTVNASPMATGANLVLGLIETAPFFGPLAFCAPSAISVGSDGNFYVDYLQSVLGGFIAQATPSLNNVVLGQTLAEIPLAAAVQTATDGAIWAPSTSGAVMLPQISSTHPLVATATLPLNVGGPPAVAADCQSAAATAGGGSALLPDGKVAFPSIGRQFVCFIVP